MRVRMAARLVRGLVVAIAATGLAASAQAQDKKIKIGVIFDLTGPLAGGGSELEYIGTKIILDHFSKSGVEGYKIDFAKDADAFPPPKWTTRTLEELLKVSFGGATIESEDHPALRRLIGARQDLS